MYVLYLYCAVWDDGSHLGHDSLSGGLGSLLGDGEDEGGCRRGGLGGHWRLGELDPKRLCEDQVVQAAPSLDAVFSFKGKGRGGLVGEDVINPTAVYEFIVLVAVVRVGSRSPVGGV